MLLALSTTTRVSWHIGDSMYIHMTLDAVLMEESQGPTSQLAGLVVM